MAEQAVAAPSIDAVLSEVFTTLALSAHTYLHAPDGGEPDLLSAEVAIDLAGLTFEKAQARLRPEERAALASMLTELRMAYVKKRGR